MEGNSLGASLRRQSVFQECQICSIPQDNIPLSGLVAVNSDTGPFWKTRGGDLPERIYIPPFLPRRPPACLCVVSEVNYRGHIRRTGAGARRKEYGSRDKGVCMDSFPGNGSTAIFHTADSMITYGSGEWISNFIVWP